MRVNYRNAPKTASAKRGASKGKTASGAVAPTEAPKTRKGPKPKALPPVKLVDEEKGEGRGQRFAKALKSASSDAAGIEAAAAASSAEFNAGAADLSNLRARNQQSTPGRARAIIKNRRV